MSERIINMDFKIQIAKRIMCFLTAWIDVRGVLELQARETQVCYSTNVTVAIVRRSEG